MSATSITGGSITVAPAATFSASADFINTTFSGAMTIPSERTVVLRGTSALSNGTINVGVTGTGTLSTDLFVYTTDTSSTLGGTGHVIFNGNSLNWARAFFGQMTIDPGITVRTGSASGRLGPAITRDVNGLNGITNLGTISAETANRTLEVGDSFSSPSYNQGTFKAINGGELRVHNLQGTAGNVVLSGANSTMLLTGNFSLDQSLTLGSGTHLRLGGTFAVNQPLNVGPGARLHLGGQWSNTAPVVVDRATVELSAPSGTNYSHNGPGSFTVSNSNVQFHPGGFPTASILAYFANGNTVSLNGCSIDNRNATFSLAANAGLVSSNGAVFSGGAVTTAGNSALSVGGTVRSFLRNVDLMGTVWINSGSHLYFGDDQFFQGVSINRGTITSTGGGTLNLTGQWRNQGTIDLTDSTLDVTGPAVQMGTIILRGTELRLASTMTAQQLNSIIGTGAGVEVLFNGFLDLGGGTFAPSASTGDVYLDGGWIRNGTIAAAGSRRVRTRNEVSGLGVLDNITLATDLVVTPGFQLSTPSNGSGITLANGARIIVNNTGDEYHERSGPRFVSSVPQTIAGSGEIVFDGPGNQARLETGAAPLTIAPGITVRNSANGGGGIINGSDTNSGHVINQGIIRASGAGKLIEIKQLADLSNPGRMEALNGGKLKVTGFGVSLDHWTNDGTIHLNAGNVTVVGNTFTNSPTGRIEGTGTLDVSGTTFINQGFVSPGLSPGQLTIAGNVTQSDTGVIQIEIGGTGAGQFDQLVVTGSFQQNGTLNIELLNGFVPSASDTFAFLTAGSMTGSGFDHVQVVGGGGTFDVAPSGGSLVLTNFQPVPEPAAPLVAVAGAVLSLARRRRCG